MMATATRIWVAPAKIKSAQEIEKHRRSPYRDSRLPKHG